MADAFGNMLGIIETSFLIAVSRFADSFWNILAAIVVLFLGYVISGIIASLVQKLFDRMRLEGVFKKFKVEDALGGMNISHVLVKLLRWSLLLLALLFALNILQLSEVTWLLNNFLLQVPRIFLVVLVLLGAAVLGEWVREVILEFGKFPMQKSIAQASKLVIVFVGIVVGLENVGIRMDFFNKIVEIVLTGIMYGIALAFGLAFGLGGQKDAGDMIRKVRKKLDL